MQNVIRFKHNSGIEGSFGTSRLKKNLGINCNYQPGDR